MASILLQDDGPVLSTTVLAFLAVLLLALLVYLLIRWRSQQTDDRPLPTLDREPERTAGMNVSPSIGTTATPAVPPTPVVSHVPGVVGDTPQTAVDIPAAPDVPADVETAAGITYAATSQAADELLGAEPAFPVDESSDLELIEGIGPRIAAVLREVGITSFAELAATPVATLRAICINANLRLADPSTWPEQARLAANGDMEGLKAFQGRLRGGRE